MADTAVATGRSRFRGRMDKTALAMLLGVLLLLAGGVGVTLAVSGRPETTYPAGSPQATVARFLRLLQDGQTDRAYSLTAFPPDAYPGLTMTRETFDQQFAGWSQTSHRVTLLQVTRQGNRASVRVEISTFSGGAFGSSTDSSVQTLTLVRHHGSWRITGPPYLGP